MISTLQDLIAPASDADFTAMLRERRPWFRRADDAGRYRGLIDWPAVRGLVESGAVPKGRLRVTRGGHLVPRPMYADGDRINPQRFAGLMAQGVSVVVNRLEQHVAAVGALGADIAARLGERVTVIAIMTAGPGGAFDLHYDGGDVLVLQVAGSKRWRYYDAPVVHPVDGMARIPPPQTPPIFDEVLAPGDLLFLPGGYWHHCENGPDLSLHLTIGMQPYSAVDALRAIERRLIGEEAFRAPLMRMTPDERTEHEAALKRRLIALIEHSSFAAIATSDAEPPNEDE